MTLDRSNSAKLHLDRAAAALRAGLPEEAVEPLAAALALDPDDPVARLIEARLALARGKPAEALAALDAHDRYGSAPAWPGKSAEVGLLRAQALFRQGQLDLAERLLTRLARDWPADARPHRLLAELHLKAGRHDQATRELRRLAQLEPGDAETGWALASLLEARDPQAALEALAGMKSTRTDPVAKLRAARLLHRAGREREAMEVYEHLLTELPDDGSLWREAGQVADALGADRQAVRLLAGAITRSDQQAPAALALAHVHAGRLATAGRCWWRICRGNALNVEALAGLLVCALASGHAKIVGHAQRALAIHASRSERQRALARMWQHAAGGMVVAQAAARAARQPAPPRSPLAALLARAVNSLEHQAQRHDRRADAHYHLALCKEALGHKDEAAQGVARALAINPQYAAAARLSDRLKAG